LPIIVIVIVLAVARMFAFATLGTFIFGTFP